MMQKRSFRGRPGGGVDTDFIDHSDGPSPSSVRTCRLCERRLDRPGVHDCTAVDCPHAVREAA